MDWELFREELESVLGYDNRDPKRGGRPPFDAVLMLKVLVLQKYYGLSDEETEFQIMDRFRSPLNTVKLQSEMLYYACLKDFET